MLVSGRFHALKYITRVDNFDEEEYVGVFLQRVYRKIDPVMNAVILIHNKQKDAASFEPEDNILKLPAPVVVGGSARKSCQFQFGFDFAKLHLA